MHQLGLLAAALTLSFLVSGCSAGYLIHLGVGQSRILWSRQPVGELLESGLIPELSKRKLELVLEAKRFGETELGLAPSENYTYYVEVNGPAIAYNLTACPALSLEPHRWCFPIAGCLPYKGFFERQRAENETHEMSEAGFDIYLRPVAAYSTLGWFLDPIFSTMLRYGEMDLVEIILHEMVHRTVFLEDQVAFNEGLATFLGEKGTLAFFEQSRGEGQGTLKRLEEKRADRERYQVIVQDLSDRLRDLYGSSLEEPEKVRRKAMVFEETRRSMESQIEAFHEPGYARILDQTWNNAFVASHLTYHQDLDVFAALLEQLGGDLRALLDRMKTLEEQREKDPFGRVRRWLEGGETRSGAVGTESLPLH